MKRIICLLCILVVLPIHGFAKEVSVSAKSAIVIDAAYGNVLYQKNAFQRLPMASTTKIMTAICAIENGNMEEKYKVHPDAIGVEGSSMYLTDGEELTLRELVSGLMLNSGNDAAVAIAYAVSGSVEKFVKLMNDTAEKLGAKDTSFCNPNGLDGENHYTTALDLANITAYALKNEEFSKIVSTGSMTVSGPEGKRYLTNHNKLLSRMDGCTGVKTGFTKKSGRCLVSSCERDGVSLVAVTLSAPDDWNDHMNMMNYAYGKIKRKNVFTENELLGYTGVEKGLSDRVKVVCPEEFFIPATDGIKYITHCILKEEITAPVKKGTPLGKAEVYMNGKKIHTLDLVAEKDVGEDTSRDFADTMKMIIENYF